MTSPTQRPVDTWERVWCFACREWDCEQPNHEHHHAGEEAIRFALARLEEPDVPEGDAAQVVEEYAERLKHTSHRDGLGMGWQAGEDLCREIATHLRTTLRRAPTATREPNEREHEMKPDPYARISVPTKYAHLVSFPQGGEREDGTGIEGRTWSLLCEIAGLVERNIREGTAQGWDIDTVVRGARMLIQGSHADLMTRLTSSHSEPDRGVVEDIVAQMVEMVAALDTHDSRIRLRQLAGRVRDLMGPSEPEQVCRICEAHRISTCVDCWDVEPERASTAADGGEERRMMGTGGSRDHQAMEVLRALDVKWWDYSDGVLVGLQGHHRPIMHADPADAILAAPTPPDSAVDEPEEAGVLEPPWCPQCHLTDQMYRQGPHDPWKCDNCGFDESRASQPQPSSEPEPVDDGAAMIAAERRRQVVKEGWVAAHDDNHGAGKLALAGAAYATHAAYDRDPRESPGELWPFERRWWKPRGRVRDLVRAGALIAAEIDRLQREEAEAHPSPSEPPKGDDDDTRRRREASEAPVAEVQGSGAGVAPADREGAGNVATAKEALSGPSEPRGETQNQVQASDFLGGFQRHGETDNGAVGGLVAAAREVVDGWVSWAPSEEANSLANVRTTGNAVRWFAALRELSEALDGDAEPGGVSAAVLRLRYVAAELELAVDNGVFGIHSAAESRVVRACRELRDIALRALRARPESREGADG